jgi:GNAT superfamily N-acetyltransferase
MAQVDSDPRDTRWVTDNLLDIARLNTVCFQAAPWFERWSDDPAGTNPRTHSPAMVRELLDAAHGEAFFFSAHDDDGLVGVRVGQLLNREGVRAMHLEDLGARAGDFYQSLVIVTPRWQGNGVSSQLINARLSHAERLGAPRIWVQTHVSQSKVRDAYAHREFRVAGEKTIFSCQGGTEQLLPSERVFLVRDAPAG